MNKIPDETLEPEQPKKLRAVLILTILTVILYASVITLMIWNYSTVQSNRGVLCALKAEHERDIRNSTQFLKDNPEGIPPRHHT